MPIIRQAEIGSAALLIAIFGTCLFRAADPGWHSGHHYERGQRSIEITALCLWAAGSLRHPNNRLRAQERREDRLGLEINGIM